MKTDKSLEKEYLEINSPFRIEKELLSSFSKNDLDILIKEFEKLYKVERYKLIFEYKKRISQNDYKIWNDFEKYFIKMCFHYFQWWVELNINKDVIKKLKFHYKLYFTPLSKYKKFQTLDLTQIPISQIISLYAKLPDNLNRNFHCPFSEHQDSSSSFRIYENTNSFHCFWCQRWGNVVNFISKIEWITIAEAYKKLTLLYNNI